MLVSISLLEVSPYIDTSRLSSFTLWSVIHILQMVFISKMNKEEFSKQKQRKIRCEVVMTFLRIWILKLQGRIKKNRLLWCAIYNCHLTNNMFSNIGDVFRNIQEPIDDICSSVSAQLLVSHKLAESLDVNQKSRSTL